MKALLFAIFLNVVLAKDLPNCPAVVEYVALVGDPSDYDSSPLYIGLLGISFRNQERVDNAFSVNWTFPGAQEIQLEQSIVKDPEADLRNSQVELDFKANNFSDSQSVELRIYTSTRNTPGNLLTTYIDSSYVPIWSLVHRGYRLNTPIAKWVDEVELPWSFLIDGMLCEPCDELLTKEEYVNRPLYQTPPSKSEILLEYRPLETQNLPYESEVFRSYFNFSFRLINKGYSSISLNALTVEYWFQGNDHEYLGSLYSNSDAERDYEAECLNIKSECSSMKFKITAGDADVHGSHYRLVISFPGSSVVISPEQEEGTSFHEETITIKSLRAHMGLSPLYDYSFINTSHTSIPNSGNYSYISREFQENHKMPVYMMGNLAWGSPPTKGELKTTVSLKTEDQRYCFVKLYDILQCGIKQRYCCSPDARDNELQPWMIYVPVLCFVLLVATCCVCVYYYCHLVRSRTEGVLPEEIVEEKTEDCLSAAYVTPGANSDRWNNRLAAFNNERGLVICNEDETEVKFHTHPFHSNSSQLRQPNTKSDSLSRTWDGVVNKIPEPWNEICVHASTKSIVSMINKSPILPSVTQNIDCIPLDVDYHQEIAPELRDLLGEGGFGKVYSAKWRGQDVAVKIVRIDSESMYKSLKDEVKLLSCINHDRIVRLLAASLSVQNQICIVMELLRNGNLSKRIHSKQFKRLEYRQIIQIGLDIAQGLRYLHPNVIHRDLKPQNILLDKHERVKIADFGISRFKAPNITHLSVTQTGGTPNYMAPELFNGTRVDEKCDIYSLGCILYEALTVKVPLSDLPDNNCSPLFQIIKTVAIDKKRPKIPDSVPDEITQIIRECWRDNPRSRPSAEQLCSRFQKILDKQTKQPAGTKTDKKRINFVDHLTQLPNRFKQANNMMRSPFAVWSTSISAETN